MNEEKQFEFHVILKGYGATLEKAWNDATEAFAIDPGIPPDKVFIDGLPMSDFCPRCLSEIELSNHGKKNYVYCPNCGPIPELKPLTDGQFYILDYPPEEEEDNEQRSN